MAGCLDADTAAAFVGGSLTTAERSKHAAHRDTCVSCRELVSMLAKAAEGTSPSGPLAPPDASAILPRGTRIGPYEVLEPLDAGGMGIVYVALDVRLDRRVALKAVRDHRHPADQLLREARTMAKLAHPNVVPVHDVVEARGQLFLAMELVVGRSVRQWLDAQPRGWAEIVDVFAQAGAGLAAAHGAGITHGDVKPGNMLMGDDGRVRVTDFGLASELGDSSTGPIKGTPGFLAPELIAGDPGGARADQYAFCVSLHQGLTGSLPGKAPTRSTHVPRAIRKVIERGLERTPERRFASMTALVDSLRSIRSQRQRWLAAAVAILLASVAFAYQVGGRRVEAAQCAAMGADLAMPWNDEARGQLERAFTATALPYAPATFTRVAAAFDAWRTSFDRVRADACAVTLLRSTPSQGRLALELQCLAESARSARALLSELRDADANVITNSVAATSRLLSVEGCATADAPLELKPLPVTDGPALREFREQLSQVRALHEAGRHLKAYPIAEQLPAKALALGGDGLQAAALVALGVAQARTDRYEAAVTSLRDAIQLSERAEDDRLRAQAWVTLVQTEFFRGQHQAVLALEKPALGACQRVGDAWLQTEVMLMVGGSLTQLGKMERARQLFSEAVAMRVKVYGEADRRSAFALSSLGNALAMAGDLDGGKDAHRRALEAAVAALGPEHPNVATLHNNLGDDYLYGLEMDLAVKELEAAARILTATGAKSREVALINTELGFALLETGKTTEALAAFDDAEQRFETVAATHPVHAMSWLGQHQARVTLGRPTELGPLEKAMTVSAGLPPFDRGRITLALAQALVPTDRARAQKLANDALAQLSTVSLPLIVRERAIAQTLIDSLKEKK